MQLTFEGFAIRKKSVNKSYFRQIHVTSKKCAIDSHNKLTSKYQTLDCKGKISVQSTKHKDENLNESMERAYKMVHNIFGENQLIDNLWRSLQKFQTFPH